MLFSRFPIHPICNFCWKSSIFVKFIEQNTQKNCFVLNLTSTCPQTLRRRTNSLGQLRFDGGVRPPSNFLSHSHTSKNETKLRTLFGTFAMGKHINIKCMPYFTSYPYVLTKLQTANNTDLTTQCWDSAVMCHRMTRGSCYCSSWSSAVCFNSSLVRSQLVYVEQFLRL